MTTLALTLAPSRSRSTTRTAFQVGCAVGGSLLIAGLAQISFTLPFTPVPITGQTLGVLLVGAAYGPALGAMTVLLYLFWAVIGLPFLAVNQHGGHDTGLQVLGLAFASGGYLWGFVLAAAVVGSLSRRGWDRTMRSSISAMLLGSIVIFGVGVPWLHQSLVSVSPKPLSWDDTFALGLYPFIIGDTLKLLAAAGLLPAAWALLRRLRPDEEG